METAAPPVMAPPPPVMAPPPPVAAAPKPTVSDDMSGQWGFGVGVGSSATTTSLVTIDNIAYIHVWFNDKWSLSPQLQFNLTKLKNVDTTYFFAPRALLLYSPLTVASTRLLIGGGLGLSFDKSVAGVDMTYAITLPVMAGVEHFFTKWFAMGIAVADDFLSFRHVGAPSSWTFKVDLSTLDYQGFLFFYTD
jgi:hypothetical protein